MPRRGPGAVLPHRQHRPAILQIEEAKEVCRRCEVREQCLAWALEAGQDHGVWGGLSEDERRALKRRNSRARVRTA
jgi:WhiB family redox-sensing transcriptional regulator